MKPYHHSDTRLPADGMQVTGKDVAADPAISWPAPENLKPGAPTEQQGWHHGFRPPWEDELDVGSNVGESPRKGMGSSGPQHKCEMCSEGHHPAFHVPEEGDLNPGNQPPMTWD